MRLPAWAGRAQIFHLHFRRRGYSRSVTRSARPRSAVAGRNMETAAARHNQERPIWEGKPKGVAIHGGTSALCAGEKQALGDAMRNLVLVWFTLAAGHASGNAASPDRQVKVCETFTKGAADFKPLQKAWK